AGRLRQFSLAEISRRLDNRLALLIGSGDPDDRHATARNAIAWSYDTCTATERALWARLSVFPGSFDAAAAAEVCASGELAGTEIYQTILRLVDKSLVMQAGTDWRGRPRYRMLDTIRSSARSSSRRPVKRPACVTASSPATWRWPGTSRSMCSATS